MIREIKGDMFNYIDRNVVLSETSYFYTPGFKFRANIVYFLIKSKINSKDLFTSTLANIHRHAEDNFFENITFQLGHINQLILNGGAACVNNENFHKRFFPFL